MNFCNYNKNIILLYAPNISLTHNIELVHPFSGDFIIFRYGFFDIGIPDRWVWLITTDNQLEYQLSEDYIGRKYPEFRLKIYWQRQGKEW
jgi:hypothetical protein